MDCHFTDFDLWSGSYFFHFYLPFANCTPKSAICTESLDKQKLFWYKKVKFCFLNKKPDIEIFKR